MTGHVQFRSWCRHCVAAKSFGQPHARSEDVERQGTMEIPEVCIDYFFMGDEDRSAPHLVLRDRSSGCYGATMVDAKTSDYAVKFVRNFVVTKGYKRILFKSDNEASILALKTSSLEGTAVEAVMRERARLETTRQMEQQRML